MRKNFVILFGLQLILGLALLVLVVLGDMAMMVGAGEVHQALVTHQLSENGQLRDTLYATVMRTKSAWALVQLIGFVNILAAMGGLYFVWKQPKV